jgi:hypothetical protein
MKKKILSAVGAVVILLGILVLIFGTHPPLRLPLSGIESANCVREEGCIAGEVILIVAIPAKQGEITIAALNSEPPDSLGNIRAKGILHEIPYRGEDIDIVIQGDVNIDGDTYREGDRLTSKDGKLVHQSRYQRTWNDVRYLAYRVRKGLTGKN